MAICSLFSRGIIGAHHIHCPGVLGGCRCVLFKQGRIRYFLSFFWHFIILNHYIMVFIWWGLYFASRFGFVPVLNGWVIQFLYFILLCNYYSS